MNILEEANGEKEDEEDEKNGDVEVDEDLDRVLYKN